MRSSQAVIGTSYGDEGKGLMTDYFASLSQSESVVVRYNGGAQAGHTVVLPDGSRHVFSHFGAGSFFHLPTYLSKFFIVNPMMFNREDKELKNHFQLEPVVEINQEAIITTPFDMLINQLVETSRGQSRHGSCGLGINETVTRCKADRRYLTKVKDLFDLKKLCKKLNLIGKEWLPKRLAVLGVNLNDFESHLLVNVANSNFEELIQDYILDVQYLLDRSSFSSSPPVFEHYIFEGAQGLLLDERRMDLFPHLTRSKTGLANVFELCQDFEISSLEVTYVTRSYLTRHGAGPLNGETKMPFFDSTNVTNTYQGCLRYAPLDIDLISNALKFDLSESTKHCAKPEQIKLDMAVTCLDQVSKIDSMPLPVVYKSYGPSRDKIETRAKVPS